MVTVSRPVLQLKDTMSAYTSAATAAASAVNDTRDAFYRDQQFENVWTQMHGWRQLTAAELSQAGDAWAWSAGRSWFQFDDPEGLSQIYPSFGSSRTCDSDVTLCLYCVSKSVIASFLVIGSPPCYRLGTASTSGKLLVICC